MPWYNEELDFDLEEKLNAMQLHKGTFLDLGTGPGTQAMQLAKKGFDVIGSDISETVIKRNKIIYEIKYQNIKFVVDNILDIFSKNFQISDIKKTVYQGTLDPLPKALFSVMKLIK